MNTHAPEVTDDGAPTIAEMRSWIGSRVRDGAGQAVGFVRGARAGIEGPELIISEYRNGGKELRLSPHGAIPGGGHVWLPALRNEILQKSEVVDTNDTRRMVKLKRQERPSWRRREKGDLPSRRFDPLRPLRSPSLEQLEQWNGLRVRDGNGTPIGWVRGVLAEGGENFLLISERKSRGDQYRVPAHEVVPAGRHVWVPARRAQILDPSRIHVPLNDEVEELPKEKRFTSRPVQPQTWRGLGGAIGAS